MNVGEFLRVGYKSKSKATIRDGASGLSLLYSFRGIRSSRPGVRPSPEITETGIRPQPTVLARCCRLCLALVGEQRRGARADTPPGDGR